MLVNLKMRLFESLQFFYKKRFKSFFMTKVIHKYIENFNTPNGEDLIYRDFQLSSESRHRNHQTPLSQLRFLEIFLTNLSPKNILEVGTFVGYTTYRLAKYFPNCQVTTIEKEHKYAASAQVMWKKYCPTSEIEIKEGDGKLVLKQLILDQKQFDCIYIDANKSEYIEYFKSALQLRSPKGYIIVDNVLWAGLTAYPNTSFSHPKIMNDLVELVKSLELEFSIIPAWDGLLICQPSDK